MTSQSTVVVRLLDLFGVCFMLIEAADGLMSSSVSTNLGQQKLLLEKHVIFVFVFFQTTRDVLCHPRCLFFTCGASLRRYLRY